MGDHLRHDSVTGHLLFDPTTGHLVNEVTGGVGVYLFYGTVGGVASQACDEYDYNADTWTGKTAGPAPARNVLACFGLDSRAYAVGDVGGMLEDNDEYNPGTDAWTSRTNIPTMWGMGLLIHYGSDVGSTGHVFGDQFSYTNHEYVVDSWSTQTDAPTLFPNQVASVSGTPYLFDGTNMRKYVIDTWTTLAAHPAPGGAGGWTGVGSATSGTKTYWMGGTDDGSWSVEKTCYEYDPTGDTWTAKTDMPDPARYLAGCLGVSGDCYVFGGSPIGSSLADVDKYSVSGDSWTSASDLAATRVYFGIVGL